MNSMTNVNWMWDNGHILSTTLDNSWEPIILYMYQTTGDNMNKTEMYRQQLRQLRSNFYAKDNPTIQEMMEFAQEEIYLVKKMNGKF